MIFNITLQNTDKSYNNMYNELGGPIHETLAGNTDYVKSNIVLNLDTDNAVPVCTLYVDMDNCESKEYIRDKAKEAIDIFINSLK